ATSNRERVLMLAPGIAFWAIVPLAFGARLPSLVLAAVAGAVGVALLVATARRRVLVLLIPVLVALELCANAAMGTRANNLTYGALAPANLPQVDATAYLRDGPIVQA